VPVAARIAAAISAGASGGVPGAGQHTDLGVGEELVHAIAPVLPEVAQVRAHLRLAGDQLVGKRQPVEGLVPELALRVRAQDAVADSGQRRRQHQRADRVRTLPRDRLRNAAADVVAHEDRPIEAQLVDQGEDARGLSVGEVGRRRSVVAVGLAEAAQVGHHHVERPDQ
jgi:hypothetical protein